MLNDDSKVIQVQSGATNLGLYVIAYNSRSYCLGVFDRKSSSYRKDIIDLMDWLIDLQGRGYKDLVDKGFPYKVQESCNRTLNLINFSQQNYFQIEGKGGVVGQ